jgi:gamma-glutamyl:cysteine ligase YbdK (ATP-grasp superfamily)
MTTPYNSTYFKNEDNFKPKSKESFLGQQREYTGLTFGIEEEVFVTEPEKPSLQSLYYLTRLFWKNPFHYYKGSSSNFARGRDIKYGLMSGVEITTAVHDNIYSLLDDFKQRRKELAEACEGLIIPLGHLITHRTPTNVCAFQVHIGGLTNKKTYNNLAYFLPLLFLLTASSPLVQGERYGQSFRLDHSYAIGAPDRDWAYRFQDIIFSKRLGTIEVKIFDPWWDLERIRILVEALQVICLIDEELPFNIREYKDLRKEAAKKGYTKKLKKLHQKLNKYYPIMAEYFKKTPADQVVEVYETKGLLSTYSALDNAYRTGQFKSKRVFEIKKNISKVSLGIFGYYIPRLPYRAWKYWKDWM